MDLSLVANVSVDPSWLLYLNIPSIQVSNVVLSHDHVGMISRRYDSLLTTVMKSFINNVNVQWKSPFDITSMDPTVLPLLKNLITGLHVSPDRKSVV